MSERKVTEGSADGLAVRAGFSSNCGTVQAHVPSPVQPGNTSVNGEPKPVTTTISTIAVQSGNTRIVLALLRSKEWLELKIQDMQPEMTKVGSSVAEAQELQKWHQTALEKLQTKQSPVEELLNQADQMIANQKPRAEVYSAMADTLGHAWKELNGHLDYRKQLLEQSVIFQTRAKEFSDKMDNAEKDFVDQYLPEDADVCRKLLQFLHDTKKGILEASKRTLNEGQLLVDKLHHISISAMGDARGHDYHQQSVYNACRRIENQIEELNDRRRRLLDILLIKRKKLLEECLQLCLLRHDINEVDQWLKTTGQDYVRHYSLGNSPANAEILQHEHRKMHSEILKIQDRIIKLTHTAEQLVKQGHFAGQELQNQTFGVLEQCTNLIDICDNREKLYMMSIDFFRSAQSAMSKLDQIEVQLKTVDPLRNSSSRVQLHSQLAQTIADATEDPITDGKVILNIAENVGTEGIAKTIAELENRKMFLDNLCTAHRSENLKRTLIFENFEEQIRNLESWLVDILEAFLRSYQDMGSVLAMAKNFLESHEKMLNELQVKEVDFDTATSMIPRLNESDDQNTREIQQRAKVLQSRWNALRSYLEQRVHLAVSYYNFHLKAVQLTNKLDELHDNLEGNDSSDAFTKRFEADWVNMLQLYQNVNDDGTNFINHSKKNDDKFLDIKRAVLCVETLLSHFHTRKESLSKSRTSQSSKVSWSIDSVDTWEMFACQVKVSQSCVEKAERDMFPIIPTELNNSQHIIGILEKRIDTLLPMVQCIQSELEKQMKIAETLTVKAELQGQKNKLIETLRESEHRFQSMVTEYQILINILISFFKNVYEMEKIIEKNESNYNVSMLSTADMESQVSLQEHMANRQTILELFKFTRNEGDQVIKKIIQLEPPDIAPLDVNKISTILESNKKNWENSWEQHKHRLEQEVELWQFNKDLQQISAQITELSKQIENMRGNYGNSVSAARNTSTAFTNFENTIEMLEKQTKKFSSTAEKMLANQHYDSSHISFELKELQNKWSKFHRQVGENRVLINVSVKYFELVEEAEEWLREGSKILITVARKSTDVKTPDEANSLLDEIENFAKSGDDKQEERLRQLHSMSVQLYGENNQSNVQSVANKTKEMKDSFVVVNNELFSLAEDLKESEQRISRAQKENEEAIKDLEECKVDKAAAKVAATAACEAQKSAQLVSIPITSIETYSSYSYQESESMSSKTLFPLQTLEPRPPEFLSLLGDAHVMEGTKVRFECSVTGTPTPQVTWYKDGIVIDNNPDYRTLYSNRLCVLCIEETFSEDSATFTCRATNVAGMAETQGRLFVQESRLHEELTAPDFVKRLESATVAVGQSFQLECQVTGYPLPVVQWTKNDVCIDNAPDYVITYNNGQCILRFEEVHTVDEAIYSCKASNQAGQAISNARITVEAEEMMEAPTFTTPLSNVMARAGQKIKLECTVRGRPKPKLTWLHNNKPIKESTKQTNYEARKATLLIPEAFPKDAGTYLIIAKNKGGEATSSCNVSVKGRLPMETSDSELASDLEPVKPRVVVPLKTVSVIEGKKARLDCTIVGQPEPEVIWYHDGKPVKESNDFQLLFEGDQCSLVIREAYLEDAGMYCCTAINSAGEASSEGRLLVESLSELSDFDKSAHSKKESQSKGEVAVAPKFTKLLNDVSVAVGKDLTFECSVTGHPDPVCQWYKGTEKIDSSGDYQIARDKTGLLSLYIPQISAGNVGVYTVKASNSAGDAKCYANLTIMAEEKKEATKPKTKAPGFTQLFSDQVVQKGKSITFECVVTGNPKPEINWSFNNAPVKPWDYEISSAGERHWLTIPVVGPRHRGRYEITAENDEGKAVCSAQLSLEFDGELLADNFKEETTESSVITKKTVSQSTVTKVASSSDIPDKMEVHKLTSAANYSYKKVGDEPAEESRSKQQTEEHEILPPEVKQESKALESASPRKRPAAPTVKEPLAGVETEEGKEINLFAVIEGEPQPKVKWFKDEKEVTTTPGITVSYLKNKAQLTIAKVQSKDSGCYKCMAENIAGNAATSADLQVKVDRVKPAFKQPIEGVVISEGETAVFVAVITGKPVPMVTWYKNNVEIDEENQNTSISFSRGRAMLRLVKTNENDSGSYKCTAVNDAGKVSSTANLKVTPTTAMYAQPCFKRPLSSISIDEGKKAIFSANLEAKPQPSVRWFKDGAEIRPDAGKVTIENGPTTVKLIVPETCVKDSGRYTCTVSNIAGTATTTANLLVKGSVMPPQFSKRLEAMVVKSGDKVVMNVEVNGIPNPTVEWFKDDNLLSNSPDTRISSIGKKHSLVIPEAFPDDSGRYSVVAKNEGGEAKSAADFIVEEDSVQMTVEKKEVGLVRTSLVK